MNYETKRWLPLRNILSLGTNKHFRSGLYRWWLTLWAQCSWGCFLPFPLELPPPPLMRGKPVTMSQLWNFLSGRLVPAVLWSPWPCSGGNGRLRLVTSHCHQTWRLFIIYHGKFLPPERFLYISQVEGQLDLGKYCLPLKQLVVWTEPILNPTV